MSGKLGHDRQMLAWEGLKRKALAVGLTEDFKGNVVYRRTGRWKKLSYLGGGGKVSGPGMQDNRCVPKTGFIDLATIWRTACLALCSD